MKKNKIILVVLLGLIVTGCSTGDGKVKTMTCTRTTDQQGTKMSLNYIVTYQGDYVKSVKTVESVTSDDIELLENYKTTIENIYAAYTELDHYDTTVTIEDNTLTSTAEIDYEKIDVDELIKLDSANAQLFEDGKIRVDTMEEVYAQVGATCTKE